MARLELAEGVADDLDRIVDHLAHNDAANVSARIHGIIQAVAVLEQNPFIGRPAEGGQRELIIGRRSRGYVALYCYIDEIDTVFVLAIRSQREAGYKP
ncbi:MAG TPA: type II toxin-antitoxin system RelE/ParE family toxin [Polyangia bacterium]|jgi:plasmid stabilization system protein ParE